MGSIGRTPIYYKKSLESKVGKLEKNINLKSRSLLIIDMNKDGTYGPDSFTEEQLNKYVEDKRYETVIIDDILNM